MKRRKLELTTAISPTAPSEFRIFRRGKNPSSKGVIVFDDAAAKSVMGAYAKQGVDLPIDLEHDSLDLGACRTRPDAADARGWFKLALRNGELWAVGVKWTPDGARRLSERTQRYISPAFYADQADRVVQVINVALCAQPATHKATPLVAASSRGLARKASEVVAVRVRREHVRGVDRLARNLNLSRADLLRYAIVRLADRKPSSILADLIASLGLDKDAPTEQILQAIAQLVELMTSPTSANGEALEETPDAPPPAAALSARELSECRKRGLAPADYAVRKANAVRRVK